MLHTDQIQYQESILRFKRKCQVLKEQDLAFKVNFEGTKPRLDVLQDDIFSTRPFDLSRNPDLDHQFPADFF